MKTKPFLLGFFLAAGPAVAQGAQFGDFQYTSSGTGMTITRYTGPGGAVIIPDTIEGLPVTSIGDEAFYMSTGLTSITIPDSVTSIGVSAFSGCTGLTGITIPNSVTNIQPYAFAGCTGLTGITIPNSVTSIPGFVFTGCTGLTSVMIPDSVTDIGKAAFSSCRSLTSVVIPESVVSIGQAAFANCTSLASIAIPNSVTSIEWFLFDGCTGLSRIAIPASVTSIGISAFRNCTGLTSITIPSSVTSIVDYAFEGCTGLRWMFFEGGRPVNTGNESGWFGGIPTTLYYRPGALGWAATVAGRPTALWLPLTLGETPPAASARLSLLTSSPPPATVRIQRSTNLRDWEDWQTVSRDSGPSALHDPEAGTVPYRFYRVVEE